MEQQLAVCRRDSIHEFFASNNCSFHSQVRSEFPHANPPLPFRLLGAYKSFLERRSKFGGVGIPYHHGYVLSYDCELGNKIDIAVDVSNSNVVRITWIDDQATSNLFQRFRRSATGLGIPISMETRK